MKIDSRNFKLVALLLLLVFIICFFGFFVYKYGFGTGFKEALNNLLWLLLIVFGVSILVAIVYILFILEKRVDVIYENYKAITGESKISKPDNLKDLYIKGDKEHKEKRLGKIEGWSCRSNYKIIRDPKTKKEKGIAWRENESCFLISLGIFKKIIIRCPTRLHDKLQGDVRVDCISLNKHSMYYYPNNIHLDFEAIDDTLYFEGLRYLQLDLISKMEPLVIKATGLNKEDLEELQARSGIQYIYDTKDQIKGGGK